MGIKRIETGLGQESVWDYPRPPRLEDTTKRVRVVFGDVTIADTRRAKRVLETSHPPVYYIPPEDIRMEFLTPSQQQSFCEWKGHRYSQCGCEQRRSRKRRLVLPDADSSFRIAKRLCRLLSRIDGCLLR